MKRRRHDIVELSSDDSLDDDFVPAKLKSKRVSIVLNKNPVSLSKLKGRRNGSSKDCKNTEAQPTTSAVSDTNVARDPGCSKKPRGRPKRIDKSKTTSVPQNGESNENSGDRNAKAKPPFSDLDDSLLIESLRPGSSKISPIQSVPVEDNSDSSKLSTLSSSATLSSTESASADYTKNPSSKTITRSKRGTSPEIRKTRSSPSSRHSSTDSHLIPGPSSELHTSTRRLNKRSKEITMTADSLGYSFCQICQKNITGYSPERRRSHVNKCCDELERANNFGGSRRSVNSQGGRSVPPRVSCPLCPKNYSDKSSLKKHLKSCCKEHGKCFETVCEVYLSTSKNAAENTESKKQTTKKTKPKEKKLTALELENQSAINAAQNKILDIIAEQDTEEIPATPALKISHLSTYRSKRNSIWNVAGSATTTVPNVLTHENSLINTPPPGETFSETVPPLPASVPDDPICLEKSSLPSQADITHLTQFLSELGKDDSMKERLTSLMLSPSKTSQNSVEESSVTENDTSQKSVEDLSVTENDTCQQSLEESGVTKNEPDVKKSTESKVIQIQNSYKSKSVTSPSKPKLPRTVSSSDESKKSHKEAPVDQPQPAEDSDPSPEHHSPNHQPEPTMDNENLADISKSPHVTMVTDRSPNPSEISAVDNSPHVRTPIRGTSEMVSSIRDAVSSLPDQSSIQEDSNLDLFGDDAVPGVGREVYDRSPDRSLLNVSPITDSGINDVDVKAESNKKLDDKKQRISPIYRPKLCSSTTRDSVAITVPVPLSNKNIQVDKEAKSLAVGTDLTTRAKATNTDVVGCKSVSCNTTTLDKAAVQSQADGDNRLTAMMLRLSQHTPSTDITLLCSDWTEKRAHRVILTVSCPALLECCDPQSPEDNPVVKLDIGSEAADVFLEYIYTQKIESEVVRTVVLSELFDIAERLEMTELTNHLHTKRTETIELELEQESGARILLNLSAQDLVNLSQQIELVSSQNKSIVSLENTFQQDIPSFQEHDVFPVPSPTDCETENRGIILDQDLFDGKPTFPSLFEGEIGESNELEENKMNGEDGSDCDDLPASGIVLEEREDGTEIATSPPSPEMTEEDRRASQLMQDVEFIDLVKKLDDPVVNSPLSFIDNLSPPKPTNDKDVPLINLDCRTTDTPSGTLKSSSDVYQSTPNTKNKRNGRASVADTPSNLDLSEYNKTPNFKGMNTPRLKAEIGKYGLKPLSKKRAVAKLEEIHRFTNKKFLKCPSDTGSEPTTSGAKSKKADPQSPNLDTEECSNGLKFVRIPKKAKDAVYAILDGYRFILESKEGDISNWRCSFNKRKRCKAKITTVNKKLSSSIPHHNHDAQQSGQKEQTSRASQLKETSKQLAGSSCKERKRRNSSSSSSSEKNCPVGDISVSEKLPKSASREVSEQVRSVIRSREDLHCQVLTYAPIDIIEIKGLLKRRTSVGLIAQVLDDLGITYFNSETKAKGFRGKGSKRPKK